MPAARDGEYEARAGRRLQASAGHGAELVAAFELPDHRLVEEGEYGRRFVLPHGYRPDGVASQGRHRGRRGTLAADVPDHGDPVPVGLDEVIEIPADLVLLPHRQVLDPDLDLGYLR